MIGALVLVVAAATAITSFVCAHIGIPGNDHKTAALYLGLLANAIATIGAALL